MSLPGTWVTWGVFTNGYLDFKLRIGCTQPKTEFWQASLLYDNLCGQANSAQSGILSVPITDGNITGAVSPALVPLISTNFTFVISAVNTAGVPAPNLFMEVDVPTNMILVGASVPWDHVVSTNAGINSYQWTFQTNTDLIQGLFDVQGNGIDADLSPNGSISITVTGTVATCGSQPIIVFIAQGIQGAPCQTVGPFPVNLEYISGQALAQLQFPSKLPLCKDSPVSFTVRNAGQSSLYRIRPAFYLPAGLSFVPESATASNTASGLVTAIPDPTGAGTQNSNYTWNESQIPILSELDSGSDIVIRFNVQVDCDATTAGTAGATASYADACGTYQTHVELAAVNIGKPALSVSQTLYDLNHQPLQTAMPGQTNHYRITISHTTQSAADVSSLQLTETISTDHFQYLEATPPPDVINGNQLIWSNATLMAAISNQSGGPFAITSTPIAVVITGIMLTNCSTATASGLVNFGCADSPCLTTSGSASVIMAPVLSLSSQIGALRLNSCGGTFTVTLHNSGAMANGIIWTNFAPPGYLVTGAAVSGAMGNPTNQPATLFLGGFIPGQYAVLDLMSTNTTNVRAVADYDGDSSTLDLGPGGDITVTYSLVTDGSSLDCLVNTYPPAPVPVTTTGAVASQAFCGDPAVATYSATALPDQAKPEVSITPKSLILTNGQSQDFTVTFNNMGDHGAAANLQARVQFGMGWTNLAIVGVSNYTGGGAIDTSAPQILVDTNGLNGVLLDLGGVVLEPRETVVLTMRAEATQGGNPLGVLAEIVGQSLQPSPGACTTFTPDQPLAMTMPRGPRVSQIANNNIYGFYQDNAAGVGYSIGQTVRYAGEPGSLAGTNRVARIGENIIYRINAQFFDAPFTNVVIHDLLPPNVVFVSAVVDTGMSTYTVWNGWNFNPSSGELTLPPVLTGDTTFVVDILATVTNGIVNEDGVLFTNVISATFQTVVTNQPTPVSTLVDVVVPALNVSTLVSASPGSDFSTNLCGLQAGDMVYFQMVITNDSPYTSYNLSISNGLPDEFSDLSLVSVTTAGGVFTNGIATSDSLDAGLFTLSHTSLSLPEFTAVDLNTNSAITIVFSAVLDYSVAPNQNLADTTTIRWTSMPGTIYPQKRNGNDAMPEAGVNASTNFTVVNNLEATSFAAMAIMLPTSFSTALDFTSVSTPGNDLTNEAAIGEFLTYTLAVTVPQGVTPNAQILDSLHPGMAFVEVIAISTSSGVSVGNVIGLGTNRSNVTVSDVNSGTGNQILVNLGNITDSNGIASVSDTLAITFRAVVLNVLSNQAGTTLTNGAVFTDTSGDMLSAASSNVTVVEPMLDVSELISTGGNIYGASVSGLEGDDTVFYQIGASG